MKYSKCTCVNVEIGSYDNQVTVRIPPHMSEYRDNRVAAGLSPYVCIDRCVFEEIEGLWLLGVKTSGCCCGHGKEIAYVGVLDDKDVQIMESLGYEHLPESHTSSPERHFKF